VVRGCQSGQSARPRGSKFTCRKLRLGATQANFLRFSDQKSLVVVFVANQEGIHSGMPSVTQAILEASCFSEWQVGKSQFYYRRDCHPYQTTVT
jgi:hypothetical protein